ncbi:unnamed protein product, partial [Effrenium voratum]
ARQRGEGEGFELVSKMKKLEDELWQRGRVHRVVLTGGPCGGKSTVMSDLVQMLSEKNFVVFTMPEIATEMFNWSGGRMWSDFAEDGPADNETWAQLQYEMTSLQMHVEDSILMMARQSLTKRRMLPDPPRGAVILLDRGVVDNVAYCTEEAWSMVQEKLGTTTARLRDRRYDHVIHLVTAANGAEKFYTLQQAEGNGTESARHETSEQARAMDVKTQQAWLGVKNHHIVSNEGKDFAKKREDVKNIVRRIIGDPVTVERKSRWVCDFLSRDEVKRLLRLDPQAGYMSFSEVRSTLLSDKVRLQKRTMQDRTLSYFYQDMKEDGTVELQFEMDAWHYQKKFRASEAGHETAVKDASVGAEGHTFDSLEDCLSGICSSWHTWSVAPSRNRSSPSSTTARSSGHTSFRLLRRSQCSSWKWRPRRRTQRRSFQDGFARKALLTSFAHARNCLLWRDLVLRCLGPVTR